MIVVNFASKEYLVGQRRLQHSLNGHKCMLFRNYADIGSPTHSESPYEFKVWAMERAFQVDDVVLWVDASMYLVGDLSKIERIIKTEGHFASEAGHWVGSWTNQFTRDYFKLTEEEAKVPGGYCMFSAGLLGLDKKHPRSMEFFRQWKAAAKAGCFRGDWSDHRHDMAVASIIASRLGMRYQRGGEHMSYIGPGYSPPENGSVFFLQGI